MSPKDYAVLAQRAYAEPPQIGAESSAARAIIDGSAVAFPGTNNAECLLADIDAELINVAHLGRLHAGFWMAFLEIEADLLPLSPDATVGHSEGAALAIIYAAVLCLNGKPPKAVWAFEPPRVSADDSIGQLLRSNGVELNLYRHGNDAITEIPNLLHDWRHPGPLIQFGTPALPIPNLIDHEIARVIEALS